MRVGVRLNKRPCVRTTVLLLGIALQVSGATQYKILSECDPSSEVRGLIAKDSQIKIHYAIASATTCYSVTSTVEGKQVRGYVMSPELDGVLAFDKSASKSRREIGDTPPPVPPAPVEQTHDPVASATGTKKAPDVPEPPKPEPPKEDPRAQAEAEAKAQAKAAAELR